MGKFLVLLWGGEARGTGSQRERAKLFLSVTTFARPCPRRGWAWAGAGLRHRGGAPSRKMIVEKPTWLRHAGLQIFSVDTQPNGLRFATAGGDHKVPPTSLARQCCVIEFLPL